MRIGRILICDITNKDSQPPPFAPAPPPRPVLSGSPSIFTSKDQHHLHHHLLLLFSLQTGIATILLRSLGLQLSAKRESSYTRIQTRIQTTCHNTSAYIGKAPEHRKDTQKLRKPPIVILDMRVPAAYHASPATLQVSGLGTHEIGTDLGILVCS